MKKLLLVLNILVLGGNFANATESGSEVQLHFASIGIGTGIDSAPIGGRVQLTNLIGDYSYWGLYGGGGAYTAFVGADLGIHFSVVELGANVQESVVFGGVGYFKFLTIANPYVGIDFRWAGKSDRDGTFGIRLGKPVQLLPQFGFFSFHGYEFLEWSVLLRMALS